MFNLSKAHIMSLLHWIKREKASLRDSCIAAALKERPTVNTLSQSITQAASSTLHATPRQVSLTPSVPIYCFTDGAAQGNGRKGCKGGLGVVFPAQPNLNLSEALPSYPVPTNNRAELLAIIRAIEQSDTIDPDRSQPLHIKSDSQLCVSTCNSWLSGWKCNGWRKRDKTVPKNVDLLKKLDLLMSKRRVKLEHVRAHTRGEDDDSKFNEWADKLATQACK